MLKGIKNDIAAGIVVFFVALPLCLGIALASGAPLMSGIIAGIVGGIIIGALSGSALGVSGPAAGLAIIVLNSINELGAWPTFLLAVMIAGAIQLVMGFCRAGFIAYFFPSSVIKGMLSGIGLLIIIKQVPHALGYDKDFIGDFSFLQHTGENSVSAFVHALNAFTPGAVIISCLSIIILILWDEFLSKRHNLFKLIPGPVIVVILGAIINTLFSSHAPNLTLYKEHLVTLPNVNGFMGLIHQLTLPDFTQFSNVLVWKTGLVLAVVASLETLLCVEATDKLDPIKRITSPNRELQAQGVGNMISGLVGGLPITQVIIRSSANINFGAKSKLSTIIHGFLLLISIATLSKWLNKIPLSSLASILLVIGYKLANPKLFKQAYQIGNEQLVPFVATIIGIIITDLLMGIAIGIAVGLFYTLKHSYKNAYYMKDKTTQENGQALHHIMLAEEVSFFNKASIIHILKSIPKGSKVIIDCSACKAIAFDVVEFIMDFKKNAKSNQIDVETVNFVEISYD